MKILDSSYELYTKLLNAMKETHKSLFPTTFNNATRYNFHEMKNYKLNTKINKWKLNIEQIKLINYFKKCKLVYINLYILNTF